MIEENDPDHDDREDDAEDVAGSWLFDDGSDANEDLNNPVYEGDEKKDDLDKAGLAIEPLH